MIFKEYRLARRLARAGKLLGKGNCDAAQVLYVSILNAQPTALISFYTHAGLAEAEFHRGRLRNARYYAELCQRHAQDNPALATEPEPAERLRRIGEVLDAIEKQWRR